MKSENIFIMMIIAGCMCLRAEENGPKVVKEYTVQTVADIPVSGPVWDLSSYQPIGPEYEIQRLEHDGTTSFLTPIRRIDFVERNDSSFLICSETRQYRVVYIPGFSVDRNSMNPYTFSFKGRIHQSDYLHGTGIVTGDEERRGQLILPNGDEIKEGKLVQKTVLYRWMIGNDSIVDPASLTDSLFYTTRVDNYMFISPERDFPIAFKQVKEYSNNGMVVFGDSTAWILTYEPVGDTRLKSPKKRDESHNSGNSCYIGTARVTVDGNELRVTLTVTDDNGLPINIASPMKVVITDLLGRSFMETSFDPTAHNGINIESLPRGEYLLQIINEDAGIDPVKFMH